MSGDDQDKKKDLTAIEDIAEYLHELDPEVDNKLDHGQIDLEENKDSPPPKEFEVEMPDLEEDSFPEIEEDSSGGQEESVDEFPMETDSSPSSPEENLFEEVQESEDDFSLDSSDSPSLEEEVSEEPLEEEVSEEPLEEEVSEEPLEEEVSEEPLEEEVSEEPLEEEVSEEPEEEVSEEPEEEVSTISQEEVKTSLPNREESKTLEKTPPATSPTSPKPFSPENFQDIKEFAKNISIGDAGRPGNPPYSIILQGIKYKEDAEDILQVLRDYQIVNKSNETIFQQGLNSGALLISQISEYVAVILAHKFRNHCSEIKMGLSEEIHPSKVIESKELISKINIHQNKDEYLELDSSLKGPEFIVITTLPSLENFRIHRYISIISNHYTVRSLDEKFIEKKYQEMAEELKNKAFKLKGNAIVGVTYQIIPQIQKKNYSLNCTGNVVWITPLKEKAP